MLTHTTKAPIENKGKTGNVPKRCLTVATKDAADSPHAKWHKQDCETIYIEENNLKTAPRERQNERNWQSGVSNWTHSEDDNHICS